MVIREAVPQDIDRLRLIRNTVSENALSDPGRITSKDYEEYLTIKGKGWVCEMDGEIIGFSIVSIEENNVWALFLKKEFEGKQIGSRLHDIMLQWYFDQTRETIWLSTAPGTRAEKLYRRKGWIASGMMHDNREIRFEMNWENWKQQGNEYV